MNLRIIIFALLLAVWELGVCAMYLSSSHSALISYVHDAVGEMPPTKAECLYIEEIDEAENIIKTNSILYKIGLIK